MRAIPTAKPDVFLMDIFLPRMSGIECTARLKAILPQTPIVMLTAHDEDEMVFLALESGASGYLLKRTKSVDLRASLLDVLSGGAPMKVILRILPAWRTRATASGTSGRAPPTHRQRAA